MTTEIPRQKLGQLHRRTGEEILVVTREFSCVCSTYSHCPLFSLRHHPVSKTLTLGFGTMVQLSN